MGRDGGTSGKNKKKNVLAGQTGEEAKTLASNFFMIKISKDGRRPVNLKEDTFLLGNLKLPGVSFIIIQGELRDC